MMKRMTLETQLRYISKVPNQMEFRRTLNGIGFLIWIAFNVRKPVAIAPIDERLERSVFGLGQFLDLVIFALSCIVRRFFAIGHLAMGQFAIRIFFSFG